MVNDKFVPRNEFYILLNTNPSAHSNLKFRYFFPSLELSVSVVGYYVYL
jgi:hypothetical protein